MKKGMNDMHSMPMSGDTDLDFAKMMRMHHRQPLDTAQMELKQAKTQR